VARRVGIPGRPSGCARCSACTAWPPEPDGRGHLQRRSRRPTCPRPGRRLCCRTAAPAAGTSGRTPVPRDHPATFPAGNMLRVVERWAPRKGPHAMLLHSVHRPRMHVLVRAGERRPPRTWSVYRPASGLPNTRARPKSASFISPARSSQATFMPAAPLLRLEAIPHRAVSIPRGSDRGRALTPV